MNGCARRIFERAWCSDAFVVMPDHVHLLIGLAGGVASRRGRNLVPPSGVRHAITNRTGAQPAGRPPLRANPPIGSGHHLDLSAPSSANTSPWSPNAIRQLDPTLRVWQRGYHDRIVRTDREAEAIRRYVAENPARWTARQPDADGHRA